MHDRIQVKVGNSLTDIPKVIFNLVFWQHFGLDFIEQCASIGELQNHVSRLLFPIDVMCQQLDHIGVVQLIMEDYLILSEFMNLCYTASYYFYCNFFIGFQVLSQFHLPIRSKAYRHIMVFISFQQLVPVQQNHVLIKNNILKLINPTSETVLKNTDILYCDSRSFFPDDKITFDGKNFIWLIFSVT